MRKSVFATVCAVVLAVPIIALAAFSHPGDLLSPLAHDGRPREFEGKFYASAGEGPDVVRFFGNIKTMSEGRSLKDMKSSLRVDMTATTSEGDITGAIDMMAYHETLYVRVSDVSIRVKGMASGDADFLSWINPYQNRWFTLDLADITSDFNAASDFMLTPDEWKGGLARVLDIMFTMEHTRFKTGNTYLLTFNPDAWADALTSVISNLDTMNPGFADKMTGGDMLLAVSTGADCYAHALTMRLKVDTTSEGDFRFARIYATLDLPDEDAPVSLALEGTLQHRPQPVYLDLPRQTEPLDGLFGDSLPFLEMPMDLMPIDDYWMTPVETPEFSPVKRPFFLPVPSATCSPDGSVRGIDLQLLEPCPGGRESRRSLRLRLEQ
ncbi:MAG: hypothetical protein V1876_00160 [Candidatus Peregrinibacteria bacterium]